MCMCMGAGSVVVNNQHCPDQLVTLTLTPRVILSPLQDRRDKAKEAMLQLLSQHAYKKALSNCFSTINPKLRLGEMKLVPKYCPKVCQPASDSVWVPYM